LFFSGHMSSEATQTVTAYEVLAWLEANKKALAVGFIAAVVIGFGVAAYRWKTEQKELAASDALLKLKPALGGSETAVPQDPSSYLRIAEQFPGTSTADRALLLAGSAYFENGKYAEAQAQFSKFLRDCPQSPFAATAAYGVAASLEAQGKKDEALAGYQNLSVRYPGASVLDDAKLGAARVYEGKKQFDSALRIYEELAKPAAGMGSATSLANDRRQALLAAHPELAKTNAPAAAAATMVVPAKTNAAAVPASGGAPARKP
jgi:predicted negative regulator of RcsB-dependent stress response